MNGYDRLSFAARLVGLGMSMSEAADISTDPDLTPAKAEDMLTWLAN